MSEFARVKDPDSGHKFSYAAAAVPEGFTVLEEPAIDANGSPLPPEYAEPKTTKKTSSSGKES